MPVKTIAFLGGPLSGQFMEVQDHLTSYRFWVRETTSNPLANEPVHKKEKFYYISKYKFGAAEVFIWEEDV